MLISRCDVEHVARLARLTLDEAEIELFTTQLSQILAHVAVLNRLDVSGVEPTFHAVPGLCNVMRPDRPGPALTADEALAAAPDRAGPFFRVPRMAKEE
jgi:aspartyl-tRNA(Asn)/glutamyl-tRNA(Gln) amidotransferase subunit C